MLLLERGGLFAWAGIILGIVLLIKILALPSVADVKITVLTTATFVASLGSNLRRHNRDLGVRRNCRATCGKFRGLQHNTCVGARFR